MLSSRVTQHLYRNSYLSYIATAGGALLVVWLLYDIASRQVLLLWFSLFLLLTMARSVLTFCYQKQKTSKHCDRWLGLFLLGTFVSGLFWGVTGFLLIPHDSLPLLDSIVYQGMLMLFIGVLIAASVITYSVSRGAYFCFALPAVVPQCMMLIYRGDDYHSFLGGFMLAYALVVSVVSIYVNRMLLLSLATQEENERLRGLMKTHGIDITLPPGGT